MRLPVSDAVASPFDFRMIRRAVRTIKRLALGDTELRQQCTVGMPDPQQEVKVWLQVGGELRDVTNNHVVACASPFTVGFGLNPQTDSVLAAGQLSLQFREQAESGRLLGEIFLRSSGALAGAGRELSLFETKSCRNYCLPWARLWAYDLYQLFVRWRSEKSPEIAMSVLGARAMGVSFILPRPVVLVSVRQGDTGNIFPMNLFGQIDNGRFAFALNSARKAAPLVEQAGCVALSNVPIERAELVRKLGGNHRKESIEWEALPFGLAPSPMLGLPVPDFAVRVREVKIEAMSKLGSHTLFFGKVLGDHQRSNDLQFCMVHGIYQAWRVGMGLPEETR